jgi:glutamate-1-semialdehyde 2,1-aminomutase
MYIPKNNKMIHSGTFNGNAISMAAGVATMADYGHDKVDYINKLGDKFKDDFLNLTERLGLKLQLNGIGSLYSIIFSGGPSNSNQSFTKLNGILNMIFFKELINRGVYISPKGMLSISTAMDLSDINFALSNMEESLIEMLPVIKDISPELLIK